MVTIENFTRVNNDVNGNPRYVTHFLNCVSDKETEQFENDGLRRINNTYIFTVNKMRTLGGKKYRGKDFGGGIVFQSYNLQSLVNSINELKK
jgi:hypothetical protein